MSATWYVCRCQPLTIYIYVLLLLKSFSCGNAQEECNSYEEGAVRLVGGRDIDEGRLEICVTSGSQGQVWGTVCNDGPTSDDGFDINAARVVCRQLGVEENALSEVVTNIYFGGSGSNVPIYLDNVVCNGTEPNLLNCTHNGVGIQDCDHREDVGIKCKRSQDCTDGAVRLVDENGSISVVGRVEYCIGGAWGTVCNYEWSEFDAETVCRQLGLDPIADVQKLDEAAVPQVSDIRTPIVLDGLRCGRNDIRLDQCEHLEYVQDCPHSDDAGANCNPEKVCNDGDVRLVQAREYQSENEGQAEFCKSGIWILICYQTLSDVFWDNHDAAVLCRQLGYNVEDRFPLGVKVRNTSPTVLNGVDCKGTERSITECSHDFNTNDCQVIGAGVICPVHYNASVCTDGDVRLQGGSLSNQIGRVEVCAGGQWGLVCADEWDDTDATIVCRQLGYTGGMAFSMSTFGTNERGLYFLDQVDCTGNESSIFDCPHPQRTDCRNTGEETGVICGVNLGLRERCTEEHTSNISISLPGSNATSLTAGSLGTCQRYLGQSDVCNKFYIMSTDYIFTNMNQLVLSRELDDEVLSVLNSSRADDECSDLISKVVCHYFFAPCGANGLLHLPLSVCPDECHYVQSTCENDWGVVNDLLRGAPELSPITCDATDTHLRGLSPCCINASVETSRVTVYVTDDTEVTVTSGPQPDDSSSPALVGLSVGVAVVCVVFLCVIVAAVLIAVLAVRRKIRNVRTFQARDQTSPAHTATMLQAARFEFTSRHDEIELRVDPKLHTSVISRNPVQHADPNLYSNKQELGLHPTLLKPGGSQMMNRISSSIIRELSSNMLIPYTRLKLMDCVGQGEFGVVYKGQYTEPEGDIGYKTSTVAVKTLKGYFDDSQVNKIMEESIKMKHFDHRNVLHLIGVCLDADTAPYIVMPFMANGSLLHYLKKERNNIVLQVGGDTDVKIDVRKRLTVMCLQIASGMEYLAGEKFVHRDLAARNCMIDIHFVIKIADFGLSEDIYAKNYFRQSGSDRSIKLPVKWMAPESLTDGVFSEKSDVWSFGVTCWEVFSGGKTPYPGVDPLLLSQMLDTEQRLNKPHNAACPDEMYELMMICWAKHPDKRPSFSSIVTTISKYTTVIAGYLETNYNPFKSTLYTNVTSASAESTLHKEDITISAEEPAKQVDSNKAKTKEKKKAKSPKPSPKATPKSSPKPSPKPSPTVSPSGSPLQSLRKVKDDELSTMPNAGIEIRIVDESTTHGMLSVN